MERLTKWEDGSITYNEKRELECGEYCDSCSQGAGICKTVENMIEKLATYEDLEEQGLLVRLPVEIETELFQPCADRKSIIRSIVINNTITDDDIYIGIVDERGNERHYSKKSIGKTVFLTREEAENKLEEMKKNEQ